MNPKLRPAIGLSLLAFAALGVWSLATKQIRLLLVGKRAEAVVERVEVITTSQESRWDRHGHRESRASHATFLHIAFRTAEGETVRTKTRVTFHTPANVGDSHPVIYPPTQPQAAQIVSSDQFWKPLIVGSFLTIASTVGGLLLLRQPVRQAITGQKYRPARIVKSSRFCPDVPAKPMTAAARRFRSLGSAAFRHALAILLCFGLPALATALAPVGRITLVRNGEAVTATTRTCLLFIVPFRTDRLQSVTKVDTRIKTGAMTSRTQGGRREYLKADDTGYLQLSGPDGSAEISVTPHNLYTVRDEVRQFLNGSGPERYSRFVVANWTFSIVFGGIVCLLPIVYGACFAVATVQWLGRQRSGRADARLRRGENQAARAWA